MVYHFKFILIMQPEDKYHYLKFLIYNSIKLNKLKPWTVDSRLTLLAQCNVPNVMRNVKFLLPKTSRRVTNIATLDLIFVN